MEKTQKKYEVEWDLKFDPWTCDRIEAAVARLRADPNDTSDDTEEFKKFFPKLSKLVASAQSTEQALIDRMLLTRRKEEKHQSSAQEAVEDVNLMVLNHFAQRPRIEEV